VAGGVEVDVGVGGIFGLRARQSISVTQWKGD